MENFSFGESVSYLEVTCIMQTDNITCVGDIHYFFFLGKEGIWARELEFLTQTGMQIRFVTFKTSRNDFHKGQAVAVIGIHIGMYLEDKTCKGLFIGLYQSFFTGFG